MALLTLHGACLSFSDFPLLDNAELSIERGERLCLVGRNGAGKSTLMKIIAGELPLDDGRMVQQQDLKVTRLEQDPPASSDLTVFDYTAEGLAGVGELLKQYHYISMELAHDPSDANIRIMSDLQEQLDYQNGWQFETRISQVLTLLNLDPDATLDSLSGGWLRKVALARALACDPDLLLLDEPTNHLDIEAINWLEDFLKDFRGAIVFISHDREFIHKLATRIIDLDRGVITSWPGNYDEYLQGKEEALRVEELQHAEFDRKLAQEEVWVRQGIKARRTRNEGRVRALEAMRMERSQRRELQGKAKLQMDDVNRSGKLVFETEGLGLDFGDRTLFQGLDLQVLRGDKIALVGPNGCGKSTLIKLLLGQLEPSRGLVKGGTKLEVAYFDQYRDQLDPEQTVMDNVGEGKQEVMVRGRSRHILGYLQDFLFEPKRARTPVKALSGGEKNRLLLAKLFLKPSNLLILDEPTNDLDVETLELLEELLADYPGTLLLVSHDRRFIDNTVTGCWLFEGDGRISDYVGGYADMMATRAQQSTQLAAKAAQVKTPEPVAVASPAASKVKKLSYKLQLELDNLPARLEQLETELNALQAEVNHPGFFALPSDQTQLKLDALNAAEAALEQAFSRWEELEALKHQD
ncbi:ATP-binding cassette ATPase Uup [Aeromonas salmonicida]|uniref:ATP-binding cassette ATPase Uup n=1 Tax=Aeromonas salmonicida TaxID=645 RepID=UPI00259E1477|nr:ABC transporter ATP-binding protein [Aeromonas salmonicida]MDM5127351.1 ABC transporter ATP-binding protein [Aeromonas salmonicida]